MYFRYFFGQGSKILSLNLSLRQYFTQAQEHRTYKQWAMCWPFLSMDCGDFGCSTGAEFGLLGL